MKDKATPSFIPAPISPGSPFNTNFGLALAIEALDENADASIIVAVTNDFRNPGKRHIAVRFHFPTPGLEEIVINALLEEIDKRCSEENDCVSHPEAREEEEE